jgi:prepilin-type N-terminal cleavage/methylation domain-containing protein
MTLKTHKRSKAFTLIELLVVIAIIGLLASIVVVNVNSARDKAKTVKTVSFSRQIYRSLGSEAVGYWGFNDNTDDISGNGNNGTLVGGPVYVSSLTFSGGNFGKALSFNGSNYVSALNSPELEGDRTFEAWINPNTGGDAMTIIEEGVSGSGQMYYVYSAGANNMKLAVDCWSRGWFYSSALVNIGQWNHVVFAYSSSAMKVRFYINGQYDTETTAFTAPGFFDTDDIYIGGDPLNSSGNYFNGLIDEVRVYSSALSSAEVQKHYVEGLSRHLAKE